jgi:transcriptional regulator with XRE-family HTH domain
MAKERALRPAEVFGRRVKEGREALHWSQQELADRLTEIGRKTDRATVTRLEQGKTLAALDMVIAVAAALHIPPVHLLVPLEDAEAVAVTSELVVKAPQARAWIRGRGLLPGEDYMDWWPHLSESGKRMLVTQTSAQSDYDRMALAATGWLEDDAIAERLAHADEASAERVQGRKRPRKEKGDG